MKPSTFRWYSPSLDHCSLHPTQGGTWLGLKAALRLVQTRAPILLLFWWEVKQISITTLLQNWCFQTKLASGIFFAKVSEPANAQRLAEDEDLFLDRSRMRAVALDDTVVTTAHK
jgi:hypothetical protein